MLCVDCGSPVALSEFELSVQIVFVLIDPQHVDSWHYIVCVHSSRAALSEHSSLCVSVWWVCPMFKQSDLISFCWYNIHIFVGKLVFFLDSHFALCSVKIFIVSQFLACVRKHSCVVFGNIYSRALWNSLYIVEWTNLGVFCMFNVTKGQNGFEIDRSVLKRGCLF